MTIVRARRVVAVGCLVVVVIVGVVGGWALYTFGSLDPSAVPSRLRLFGRVYRSSLGPDATSAPVGGDVFRPVIGAWPLVMPWDRSIFGAGVTPTVVWLEVDDGRVRSYSLSGGP
jgi:hypothetical protein